MPQNNSFFTVASTRTNTRFITTTLKTMWQRELPRIRQTNNGRCVNSYEMIMNGPGSVAGDMYFSCGWLRPFLLYYLLIAVKRPDFGIRCKCRIKLISCLCEPHHKRPGAGHRAVNVLIV